MLIRCLPLLLLLMLLLRDVHGEDPPLPPGDDSPILRLDARGPLGYVSELAFRRRGEELALYAAGWDKVVHVWHQQKETGRFAYDGDNTFRVPVGAGLAGSLSAAAVSPAGRWLAVAGRGRMRGSAGLRDPGLVWPSGAITEEMIRDQGLIYVFNTRSRKVSLLRGHRGSVRSMSFAPSAPGKPPLLISAADERRPESDSGFAGRIRVWNVAAGRQVGVLKQVVSTDKQSWYPLPRPIRRPGLSAWHTGDDVTDLRVAIAWGDNHGETQSGVFRIWDVATGQVSAAETPPHAVLASLRSAEKQTILAGHSGEIGLWDLPGRREDRLPWIRREQHFRSILRLPNAVPEAMALIPNAAGRAAVITVSCGQQEDGHCSRYDYRLHLIDLDDGRHLREPISLWSGRHREPTLAVDEQGEFLAVGGNDEDHILLYRIDALPGGQTAPQTLRGRGEAIRHVSFVEDGGRIGLLFSRTGSAGRIGAPPRPPRAGDRVFDIRRRRITEDIDNWTTAAPDRDDWTVQHNRHPNGREEIVLRSPQGALSRVELADREKVTALALCPEPRHAPVPLLAVASHYLGQPSLGLYDGDKGELIRRLNGHTGRITSLAFSRQGKFLVSAAEDRRISVWWLADLKTAWGQFGLLRGVEVQKRDDHLIITRDTSQKLDPGARLLGAVEKNPEGNEKLIPLSTPYAFYDYISRQKPSQSVVLRLSEADADGSRDVSLTVDRAIDERKPLFSLFMIPAHEDDAVSWIGWDSLGKYDASGARAERHLGWHFNTGEAEKPVKFASADQYRQQNYQRGLLQKRIENGPNEGDVELGRPQMSMSILSQDGSPLKRDYHDHYPARTTDLQAVAGIGDFPDRAIATVQWRLNQGPFRSMQPTESQLWEADLSEAPWKRGVHTLEIRLRTREFPPREFTVEEFVRYQPEPPEFHLPEKIPAEVTRSPFSFLARIQAPVFAMDEEVQVTLLHKHQGEEVDRFRQTVRRGEAVIEESLKLQPGKNVIELKARNKRALQSFAFAEQTRRTWAVELRKPRQPRIASINIRPQGAEQKRTPAAGEPVVVDVPRVTLYGEITAEIPLKSAALQMGEDEPQSLTDLDSGTDKTYTVQEQLALKPGRQRVWLMAETDEGTAKTPLDFVFRPSLPEIAEVRLADAAGGTVLGESGGRRLTLAGSLDKQRVQLAVTLTRPEAIYPHRITLTPIVGNERREATTVELDEQFEVDEQQRTVTTAVDLQPGRNPVRIELSNQWDSRTRPAFEINYVRPPRIRSVDGPETSERPSVDLTCLVAAPPKSPPHRVQVEVNGEPSFVGNTAEKADGQNGRIAIEPVIGKEGRWKVHLTDLRLQQESVNQIAVLVWNEEIAFLKPSELRPIELGTHQVEYTPPAKPEPPAIELLQPRRPSTISRDAFLVEFRIRSPEPPEQVAVLLKNAINTTPRSIQVPTDSLPAPDQEGFRHIRRKVALEEGVNVVSVRASGSGGLSRSRKVQINHIPAPFDVEVKKLVVASTGKVLRPKDGRADFPPAPEARVQVAGVVESSAGKQPSGWMRIWVNGFFQRSVSLDSGGQYFQASTGQFEIPVVLNQAEANEIEIELAGTASDAASRDQFQLDCREPDTRRTLHLLAMGAKIENGRNTVDPQQLKRHASRALGVHEKRSLGTAFDEVAHYPISRAFPENVLAGRFTESDFLTSLVQIRQRIRIAEIPNHVVAIYYQGTEVRTGHEDDFALATGDPPETVAGHVVSQKLKTMPGAHLLCLDMEHPPGVEIRGSWPKEPHLGLIRVVWSGEDPPQARLHSLLGEVLSELGQQTNQPGIHLQLVSEALSERLRDLRALHGEAVDYDLNVPGELKRLLLPAVANP